MRPGEESPSWRAAEAASSFGPVYTAFSLGGGARSLQDHSQRRLEDEGAWETPLGEEPPGLGEEPPGLGEGPPGLGEGLARSAPWRVCCCLDSACRRKSAPLYLEPCSGSASGFPTSQLGKERDSLCEVPLKLSNQT